MYLKSIEIQGFKSFANKLLFEFHNGITGIEAQTEVERAMLPMQSAGCLVNSVLSSCEAPVCRTLSFPVQSLGNPQGFAYVAITLDNSDHQLAIDYDQVTVSRRLYRSGESEYMINGSTCRLKDIN